jgi:hypothetical protein
MSCAPFWQKKSTGIKMKNLLTKTVIALSVCIALVACGGNASAGVLSQNFVADNGAVFQVNDALSFKFVVGAVEVVSANGTTYSYPDATGNLYYKIITSPSVTAHYFQVVGTFEHMNTTAAMSIVCYNGNKTTFTYAQNIPPRLFADNCVMLNLIRGQAN